MWLAGRAGKRTEPLLNRNEGRKKNKQTNVKKIGGCGNKGANAWIPDAVNAQLESPDKVVVRPASAEIRFSDFLDFLSKSHGSHLRRQNEKKQTKAETPMLLANASFYLEYTTIASVFPEMVFVFIFLFFLSPNFFFFFFSLKQILFGCFCGKKKKERILLRA